MDIIYQNRSVTIGGSEAGDQYEYFIGWQVCINRNIEDIHKCVAVLSRYWQLTIFGGSLSVMSGFLNN